MHLPENEFACRKVGSDLFVNYFFELANRHGRGRGDKDRKGGIFPFDKAPNFVGCIGHFSFAEVARVARNQLRPELAAIGTLMSGWLTNQA